MLYISREYLISRNNSLNAEVRVDAWYGSTQVRMRGIAIFRWKSAGEEWIVYEGSRDCTPSNLLFAKGIGHVQQKSSRRC